MVLNVGTPAAPLGAAKNVLAVWLAKFDAVTANVPPRVIVPEVVMVPPVSVKPLTVPAVATEVTVPRLPVNVTPLAVTLPGKLVLPSLPSNVAVRVSVVNTPVYWRTCIGSVPSSAVAISK